MKEKLLFIVWILCGILWSISAIISTLEHIPIVPLVFHYMNSILAFVNAGLHYKLYMDK